MKTVTAEQSIKYMESKPCCYSDLVIVTNSAGIIVAALFRLYDPTTGSAGTVHHWNHYSNSVSYFDLADIASALY